MARNLKSRVTFVGDDSMFLIRDSVDSFVSNQSELHVADQKRSQTLGMMSTNPKSRPTMANNIQDVIRKSIDKRKSLASSENNNDSSQQYALQTLRSLFRTFSNALPDNPGT